MTSSDAVSPSPSNPPLCGGTILRVAALAILSAALRALVWRHPIPVHGDELEFIAALGFPTPHPVHHPGFPLWIALGSATHALGLAPYAAYQVWSCAAAIAAPLLLYVGLRRLVSDGLAWWTAAAFSANPLLWFCSVTALNYALTCCISLIIVGACWTAVSTRRPQAAIRASIWLAIALMLRIDLLVWLGPLVIYSAARGRAAKRSMGILAIGAAVASIVTWLLYRGGTNLGSAPSLVHTLDVILSTSVFRLGPINGLLRNGVKLAAYLAWDFGMATFVLVALAFRVRAIARVRPGLVPFLTVWVLPLCIFLVLIHMSEATHALLLIPAGYVLLAFGLDALAASHRAVTLMAALAIGSVLQFAAYPWSAESGGLKRRVDAKVGFISAHGLRHIDQRDRIHRPGDFWPTAAHENP